MKQYFAKFVEVPGEIKEGDHGITPNGSIIYFNKAKAKHFGPDCKLVKLSICSRDGDKVIGTISSGAIWVKPDNEFDKEELFAQGLGVNWDDSHSNLKFKIKCSQCQTYH